jgi:hypothetical protein
VGGDVPPELAPEALIEIPRVVIGRGSGDALYSDEQFAQDESRLRECGVNVHRLLFTGGHEWPTDFGDPLGWLLS